MSNISINSENFSRYAKRLQKNSEKYGIKLSLSEAQELFSVTLGAANLFEMQTILAQPSISREEEFISKYKEIIDNEPAIYKSSIYVDYGNMIIDITGHNSEEVYSIYFGSEIIDKLDDFKTIGIPIETSEKLVKLFNKYNPVEKYAGLLFGSNVRNLMMETSKNKDLVYFKNKLFSHQKKIDGKIYTKRYMVVTDKGFKSIVQKIHPSGNYCIMRSDSYPGFDEDDKDIALDQIKKNDSIVIEYYYEADKTPPKCLMSRFWTSIDGIIQEYQPEDYKLDLHS